MTDGGAKRKEYWKKYEQVMQRPCTLDKPWSPGISSEKNYKNS